jgi:hypothetical protein
MFLTNKGIKRIEQYKALMNAFADPCDDTIYHYTTNEGLRGILENNELWLSNAYFLNDTTECSLLQQEYQLLNDNTLKNKYVKNMWESFSRDSQKNDDTYIISFSRGEESLEQWRGYGDFRIGFDAKKLIRHPYFLYNCVYSKEEIKDWILEKSELKEWQGDCLDNGLKRSAAFNLIYTALMKFKNKYFINEREARLVVASYYKWTFPGTSSFYDNVPPLYYRDHTKYKLPVPYVKFFISEEENQETDNKISTKETYIVMRERKLKEDKEKKRGILPITEILIGPMRYQKEAKKACEILLSVTGYNSDVKDNVKVNLSNIPYRGD